ncbi:MAG: YqhA family protein [Betaproteobacteria bacterium]|nr:YqhA family protein [Betaproteobacteria bacterium]
MMLRKLVSLSRYVIAIPFFFTLLFALFLIIYESASVVLAIFRSKSIFDPSVGSVKAVAISIIEGIDVYLIAIGAYIISMGLYSLFIDDDAPLPKWLQIHDLEDLKRNLMSVIIAVLAVLFLKEVFIWDGSRDILSFGIAISAIIVSLVLFMGKLNALKGGK